MKRVKYVPKDHAHLFLQALQGKFSKLQDATQLEIPSAINEGKMHLLAAFDDSALKGGVVVLGKRTSFGPTAFVYGIFGTAIADKEYYESLTQLLKAANFSYIQGFGRPAVLRTYQRAGLPFEQTSKNDNGIFFGAKL